VLFAEPNAKLHLYGKQEPRPGRKMGHFTVLGSSANEALEKALSLRERLTTKK
jgi:5-(carboxyamino)imidazole ribonucleotide synthase